jgi:ribosomal protein S18 acetylase RimI-like enzyme
MSREEIRQHLSFGPVNKSTVGLLKILHRELLPVQYTDDIYELMKDRKQTQADLAFLYDDTAVGEVSFRVESYDGGERAYIMTIGVLKTYQRLGIGTLLLEHAISEATKLAPINQMYLHVHAANETAMAFYRSQHFLQGALEPAFYQTLENGDAYLFSKAIARTD